LQKSSKGERRDFPQWKVDLVYIAQDGVCTRCGGTLAHGFHRHHKDGNPHNNSIDNLELLCAECHRATLGDKYKAHVEQEKRVLENLNKLIELGFEGKLSGANMERLLEAMTLSLKVSRQINELDKGIEYPSPWLVFGQRQGELARITEAYLNGLREGIKLAEAAKNGKQESN